MLWKWLPDLRNLRVITLNPSGIYAASNFGTVTETVANKPWWRAH